MIRYLPCFAGMLFATPVFAQEDVVSSFSSKTLNSFADSANTENWTGSSETQVQSGVVESAFPDAPVLRAVVVPGSKAGANVRPQLTFTPIVLDQTNEFIRMRLKLRFASAMAADRRLRTAFWNSATASGYLSYSKAGSVGTFSGNIVRQSAMPELGLMNNGSITNLITAGDRAVSLGTSQSAIRDVTLLAYLTADNTISVRCSCTNDNGDVLSISATDADSSFNTFDRFGLMVWGNSVSVEIDEAELSNGILVPPGVWDGEAATADWSLGDNWAANTVPVADARLIFGPASLNMINNDLPANSAFNGMEFSSGAFSYDIGGRGVRLGGGIRNSSSEEQRISLPIELTSHFEVRCSSGPVVLSGPVGGAFGLVKSGAQSLTLSGENTYTGSTTVKGGSLTLTRAALADTAALEVRTGATVALDFEGGDTVGSLILGTETFTEGTYDATSHPAYFTGTGSIILSAVSVPAFTVWINGFPGLAADADKTPKGDPDKDGMPNYQEFAFDSDPSSANVFTGYAGTDGGVLTLTIPVRTGLTWSGEGPMISTAADGISYRVEGSADLAAFTAPVADATVPATGLPAPRSGWEYRAFRLKQAFAEASKGFLRAAVTEKP